MQWLRILPLARKFGLAFGVVCALWALRGGITFLGTVRVSASIADIIDNSNSIPSVLLPDQLRLEITQTLRADLGLLVRSTDSCIARNAAPAETFALLANAPYAMSSAPFVAKS